MSKSGTTFRRFYLFKVALFGLCSTILFNGCSTSMRYDEQPGRNPLLITGLDSRTPDSRNRRSSTSPITALADISARPPAVTSDQPSTSIADLDQEIPVDRGAAAVLRSIENALADYPSNGQPIVVSLVEIRNLSRGSNKEFHRFIDRLAGLFTDAGRETNMRFSTNRDEPADYRLTGAVYLIMDRDTQLWEMYLRLLPADETWTVWRTHRPLRILRHPRENHRQVFWKPRKR